MSAVSWLERQTSSACCSGESSSPKAAWMPPWALAELQDWIEPLAATATGVGLLDRGEADAGREAERVHRPVRQPVRAAERLRHRMGDAETGERERLASGGRTSQEHAARTAVCGPLDDAGEPLGDQRGTLERAPV